MSTDISHDEAQESLAQATDMMARTRKAVASGCSSSLLILWGALWMVAFTGTQFLPRNNVILIWWLVLMGSGVVVSWLIAGSRKYPVKSPLDKRVGLFWLFLYLYAHMWIIMMFLNVKKGTITSEQMALFESTIPMFAYVVMGLWTDRFLMWLGLFVTATALAGYFLVNPYFCLWMAVTGGGALMVTGLYIRHRWT